MVYGDAMDCSCRVTALNAIPLFLSAVCAAGKSPWSTSGAGSGSNKGNSSSNKGKGSGQSSDRKQASSSKKSKSGSKCDGAKKPKSSSSGQGFGPQAQAKAAPVQTYKITPPLTPQLLVRDVQYGLASRRRACCTGFTGVSCVVKVVTPANVCTLRTAQQPNR